MSKAFLEDFDGFMMSFSWLFGSKTDSASQKAKLWKTSDLLSKTYVLEGPRLSILVEKAIKNAVGTRGGIWTGFFMIFDGFRPPFWGQFREKSYKKTMQKTSKDSDSIWTANVKKYDTGWGSTTQDGGMRGASFCLQTDMQAF
jgi:hypothetical protein